LRFAVFCLLFLATLAHSQPVRQSGTPDLPAAENSLAQLVKTAPSAQNWERLGLIRHLQNKYDSAIPAFREAVRLDVRRWTAHLFLGLCLYRTNQFEAALASLKTADTIAPTEGAGRDDLDFWLGAAQIALRNPLDGLVRLERVLQRNPRHADALELSVRTAADASTSAWNRVAESAFETAAGYEVHGHALESEGNRSGAIEAFRRSKELDPLRAGPGLAIGRLLLLEGKAPAALEILREEVKWPACDPAALYYAGLAAIQTGNYADAAPWLDSAARVPARNPEAPLALAQVYLALSQPENAVRAAQQAVARDPSSSAAHELLIAALARAGRKDEAAAEQKRWAQRP
jgi:tetratricopeptide (TPR) repeat protein